MDPNTLIVMVLAFLGMLLLLIGMNA